MFLQLMMFLVAAATMLDKCSCNTTIAYNITVMAATTLRPPPALTSQQQQQHESVSEMKKWLDADITQAQLSTGASLSSSTKPTPPPPPRECGSIDVRNECNNLWQLKNCQIIKGYLMIVLLPRLANPNCKYEQFSFPLLREITDFLILFDVKGLRSVRDLFPNLTVIRGRRLFLNYALGITNMPNLEVLEFRSLVTIQRGHVFIGSCPKLCNLDKINWDRLTPSPGENHIIPVAPETCTTRSECKGCETGYCWSNAVCQKFDNDNVVNLKQGSHYCHEECLGGCYNSSASDACVVCKRLTDHGACVKECPEDKFLLGKYERCYTKDECTKVLGMYAIDGTCDANCPNGFISDDGPSEFFNCVPCQPRNPNEAITIFNLADADHIRGCETLNGSLVISIRNKIDEQDLMRSLGNVKEIIGHLKVYRSPHLTSLRFLHSLQKVSGNPLENGVYAFIVYDNKNLRELWSPENFEMERGSMYVHLNSKLCNHKLKEFREKVIHDVSLDSVQMNDQDVLCGPAKLMLETQVISHRSFKLTWHMKQTSDEIEIVYRSTQMGTAFLDHSELDSNVCTRINWQRRLVFRSELRHNGTHYSYTVGELEPHTRYACLVKTFGNNYKNDARSELKFVTTKPDMPTAPIIQISKKTETSLTIQLQQENRSDEFISSYVLELYELPDDIELLDKRNYCHNDFGWYAHLIYGNNEDYEKCCARLEEEAEDSLFKQKMRDEFRCSLDNKQNCLPDAKLEAQSKELCTTLRLERNETKYTHYHLERYRLYALQVKACNEVGCSSFAIHYERTNFSTVADKVYDLRACRQRLTGSDDELNEYHVYFKEPKHPNGAILSYSIHFHFYIPDVDADRFHVICVTRLQHAQAKFEYVTQLNGSFSEVAVRVRTLAGYKSGNLVWINVTTCPHSGPTTKIAGIGGGPRNVHGWNIFLICFFIGAGSTLLWVCYKRRYWRKIHEMRRYLPLHRSWRTLVARPAVSADDDRQILVGGFDSVRFHNDPDDARKYLE